MTYSEFRFKKIVIESLGKNGTRGMREKKGMINFLAKKHLLFLNLKQFR